MIPNTVVGSVMGTGAAINVVLGFKPDHIEIINDTSSASLEKFRGSANTTKTVAAGTRTTVTGAAGVSDYSGSTGEGFTIPADANVNVAAQLIRYKAIRTAPGGH